MNINYALLHTIAFLLCVDVIFAAAVFEINDKFGIECKTQTGEWGPGPICIETGLPMQMFFGVDGFQRCGWHIDSVDKYVQFAKYVNGEAHMACRVPMVPEHEFYIPFTIPLWGVVEADHTHVGSHINFVFHADDGKVTGVASYPVLDSFQYIAPGSIFHIHGPIKWFKGHSFQDVTGRGMQALLGDDSTFIILLWILSSGGITVSHICIPVLFSPFFWSTEGLLYKMLVGAVIYRYFLKPRLIKKYLKKD